MADNVTLNIGSGGDVIAADEISSVKYQRVKVTWGTDGTATDASASNPIPVVQTGTHNIGTVTTVSAVTALGTITPGTAASSLGKAEDAAHSSGDTGVAVWAVQQATPADNAADGDYAALKVSGGRLWVSPLGFPVTVAADITRPSDTTAYANNDCWSDSTTAPTAGGFTFTGAARKSGGSGIILDAIFTTSADASPLLQAELFLFNTSVTNVNDNSAFAVSDAEIKTCVAKVPFTLEDVGNNGFYHAQNLNIGFTCSESANLRYLIRVKNAYTPASAEVLTCTLKILQID